MDLACLAGRQGEDENIALPSQLFSFEIPSEKLAEPAGDRQGQALTAELATGLGTDITERLEDRQALIFRHGGRAVTDPDRQTARG